ncbi:hypothetical protein ACIP5Y_42330 [Nocardia sp. NPDC088792]|uniref:hypothetical protein n=1 Tax=Nocardia sp. NPDC088792 TaxID=3364332 RepID=UPI003820B4C2
MHRTLITALAGAALALVVATGTATAQPANRLHEGMQVVGQDVQAGTYSTSGPRSSDYGVCYIFWLPYKGAKTSDATDAEVYTGTSYVQLKAGDVITVTGCTWTLE